MGGRILVGSCSWADRTLIDSGWYPPTAKSPAERLRFYSEQFPIVEVDSTYYAIPLRTNAEGWIERTPPDFTFDVKAYGLFTLHGAAVQALKKEIKAQLPPDAQAKRNIYYKDVPTDIGDALWQRFLDDVLLPLDSAGKLGVVLFQFPPWFGPRRDNRDYIIEVKERLGQFPLAVEFRNSAWMAEPEDQERTLKFLADHAIVYVCVDEPQGYKTSVPPVTAATTRTAVLRMHGHNAATWNTRAATAADRFDYLYGEDELREWAPRIVRLAEEADEVHVLMNNCHRDYSVRNAREIGEMLGLWDGGSRVPGQGSRVKSQGSGVEGEGLQERML